MRPVTVEAHIGLALGALADHDYGAALESCARALEINPNSVESHTNKRMTLEHLGRLDEAAASYRAALHIDPAYGDAHRNLGTINTDQTGDPHIAAMAAALDDPATTTSNRLNLHSALAKAYEDIGKFDKVFACLDASNNLRRETISYVMADRDRDVDQTIATFTPALLSRFNGGGCESELPIFIVGMPRSGTSLVEQVIASHDEAFGAGERPDMDRLSHTLPALMGVEEPFPECVAGLDETLTARLADEYLTALSGLAPEAGAARRTTDKMPGNFLLLGLIAVLFPEARVIHCRREPMDTCLSCYFQAFVAEHEYTDDLSNLGAYYQEYERLMAHWREALPLPLFEVAYEELIADQERVSRELIAFCGLEWDDACLRFHETDRHVRTASYWQVRQPIYSSSVERWRNYEEHLAPLRHALGRGHD